MAQIPIRLPGLGGERRQGLPVAGWTVAVFAIALTMAIPIIAVLAAALTGIGQETSAAVWSHLVDTVLPTYVLNSLGLMVGVGLGVLLIGVSTAALVAMCEFPGRQVFEWALLLPLSAPAYLLAYTYTDFLEYFGPVQTLLRTWLGWQSAADYWFPEVRSLFGAVVLFSLVLYPYVYLLARVSFLEQSLCTVEASRGLGCGGWRSFFAVALPLARPAIAAGTALALMETLNDFGTVEYFSIPTFSTGIYRTWFGMGDRLAATQLASLLLLFIAILIGLERISRRQARYYQPNVGQQLRARYPLSGGSAIAAIVTCTVPIVLGLLLPAGLLLQMTLANWTVTLDAEFWQLAQNSLWLGGITALLAIGLAMVLGYGARMQPDRWLKLGVQMAALGYAVPGAVIAVGILIPAGRLDALFSTWAEKFFGQAPGLLFSGTAATLVFAYLVRFLAISLNTVESGLSKIRPTLDDASRCLGNGSTGTLVKIHAPLLRGSLLTAATLVFVDVLKELPATIVIRPFNFDTLAVRVYQYASDERLVEASAPALAILVVGLLPVILLSRSINQR